MLDLNKLEYIIIDRKSLEHFKEQKFYCRVYEFWKVTWKKVLEALGNPSYWTADDFFRQDYVPVITYEGQILSTHCYTLFDIRDPCVFDMKYFSVFPDKALNWIKKSGCSSFMSMEFLNVAPGWRKKEVGFSLAEVMVLLGARLMKELKAEVALGLPIKVSKVDEMADRLSFSVLAEGVNHGSIVCDIVALSQSQIKDHPDQFVERVVEYLWSNRKYVTDLDQLNTASVKAA